ncbi:MAG TPA: hypothetical protein VF571_05565 [Pyrinomonadaceae bacterium]|jgi:hypothetical protein
MSDSHPTSESPYVGLVPFSEGDAQFFFGREKERDTIIENLRASRLTLLYGTSGVGKSSVLNAGVADSLNQLAHRTLEERGMPEFALVIFSDWSDDPIARFMQSVQKAVAKALEVETLEAVPDSGDMVEMLRTWSERFGLELLIILDQFEEYFNYISNEKAENSFAAQLPRAINDLNLRAKFLISLREDSLAKLDRFKPEIPYIFDNTYRLEHMNAKAARDAIKKPLDVYNEIYVTGENEEKYSIEPALIDEIIVQLTNPENASISEGQNESFLNASATPIEAPYLQLVMTRLWEKEQSEKSRVLRLDTLRSLEGLKNIVQTYLNSAMNNLPQDQSDIAAGIFKYLVTPSGTKIAYTEADLAESADVKLDKLSPVLEMLNHSRILRLVDPPLNRPNESRYEVFHDVLAKAILKWRSEYIQRRKLEDDARKRKADENAKLLRYGLVGAGVVLLLLSGLTIFAVSQMMDAKLKHEIAIKKQIEAQEQKKLALEKQIEAEEQKTLAQEQQEEAEKQGKEAEKQRKEAEEQQEEAVKQREIAEEQKKIAEEQKNIADEERKEAVKQKNIAEEERERAREQAKIVESQRAEVVKAKGELEVKNKDLEEAVYKQKEAADKIKAQVIVIEQKKDEAEKFAKIAQDNASKAKQNEENAKAKEAEAKLAQAETQKQLEEVKKLTNVFQEINNDTSLNEECRDKVVGILQRLGEDPSNLTPQTNSNASKKWTNGKTLHIKFMERNPKIESKLEEIAHEWEKYANLKFVFGSSPTAEIRISFNNVGSWSYVGTDALGIPQNMPTMSFGILKLLNPDSDEFRRTVLHEFGHVLGLVEEHTLPSAGIQWNKSAVYKAYGNNRQWVDNYFFRKHSINYRPFDRNSIMIPIAIPKEWLIGDSFKPITEPNSNLSESDKEIARQWYPRN